MNTGGSLRRRGGKRAPRSKAKRRSAAGSRRGRILVAGAGGFIGHHLVKRLKADGLDVRGVDLARPAFERSPADEYLIADLRRPADCLRAMDGATEVYQLAADMGGIGYISRDHARIARNNVLINVNMLEAAREAGVQRYLYTSSACVYPAHLQSAPDVAALAEDDAIPADPEEGYGWEKLFSERLTTYYHRDHGLDVRIVRFHNVYGPLGSFEGGREKAPAAICRKVAEARDGGKVEVWGDGQQTRSFCYIDDCVEGLLRIMDSGYAAPLNLGSDELVTIGGLVDLACKIAGKSLRKRYVDTAPQGVRGRNSDNTRARQVLGWAPGTTLRIGLAETYSWIWGKLELEGRARPPAPARSGM